MNVSRLVEPKDRDFPSGKDIPAVTPLPIEGPSALGKKLEMDTKWRVFPSPLRRVF